MAIDLWVSPSINGIAMLPQPCSALLGRLIGEWYPRSGRFGFMGMSRSPVHDRFRVDSGRPNTKIDVVQNLLWNMVGFPDFKEEFHIYPSGFTNQAACTEESQEHALWKRGAWLVGLFLGDYYTTYTTAIGFIGYSTSAGRAMPSLCAGAHREHHLALLLGISWELLELG